MNEELVFNDESGKSGVFRGPNYIEDKPMNVVGTKTGGGEKHLGMSLQKPVMHKLVCGEMGTISVVNEDVDKEANNEFDKPKKDYNNMNMGDVRNRLKDHMTPGEITETGGKHGDAALRARLQGAETGRQVGYKKDHLDYKGISFKDRFDNAKAGNPGRVGVKKDRTTPIRIDK